jgi:hypothetical protein
MRDFQFWKIDHQLAKKKNIEVKRSWAPMFEADSSKLSFDFLAEAEKFQGSEPGSTQKNTIDKPALVGLSYRFRAIERRNLYDLEFPMPAELVDRFETDSYRVPLIAAETDEDFFHYDDSIPPHFGRPTGKFFVDPRCHP